MIFFSYFSQKIGFDIGDNLNERSKPTYGKNKKKYFKILHAECYKKEQQDL